MKEIKFNYNCHSEGFYPKNPKKAFTLAEVLITLAIIGVVASMTVPALQNNINESQYKVLYKKAYAEAQQAMIKVRMDDKLQNRVDTTDINNYYAFVEFKSKFNIMKECNDNESDGVYKCWKGDGEKSNGGPAHNSPAFITNSGMTWSFRCASTSSCDKSMILLDTNALKGPNKFGKDRWVFYFRDKQDANSTGVPVKFIPCSYDIQTGNDWLCPTGPCYYKSWLIGDK